MVVVGAPVPQRDQIGRKRRLSETLSPEKLIEQSEEAIKVLKKTFRTGELAPNPYNIKLVPESELTMTSSRVLNVFATKQNIRHRKRSN